MARCCRSWAASRWCIPRATRRAASACTAARDGSVRRRRPASAGRAVSSFASRLFSDDATAARASMQRLAELDVDTIVFSHYPPLRDGRTRVPSRGWPAGGARSDDRHAAPAGVTMETLVDAGRARAARRSDRPALLIRPAFRTRSGPTATWPTVPRAARVLAEAGLEPGRPGHHLGGQPARVGHRLPGALPTPAPSRSRSTCATPSTSAAGRGADRREARPRHPPDRGVGARARPADRLDRVAARPGAPRRPLPPAADRRRHPRRDRLHQRHHRRAEGRDADPRQPHGAARRP